MFRYSAIHPAIQPVSHTHTQNQQNSIFHYHTYIYAQQRTACIASVVEQWQHIKAN